MKKKIKLRDMTEEQYEKWYRKKCLTGKVNCESCAFSCSTWVKNKDIFSNKFLDQEIEIDIEKPKPTKEEIMLLKLLKPEYKWIAKDKTGNVYIYENKPKKNSHWVVYNGVLDPLNHLLSTTFDFLSWEDEEPTNIQELITKFDALFRSGC